MRKRLPTTDKALALKPDFAETFNNRGNALFELRRHEEALISYDLVLALRPDYVEALHSRGIIRVSGLQSPRGGAREP